MISSNSAKTLSNTPVPLITPSTAESKSISPTPVGVARLTAEISAVFCPTATRWPLVRLVCVFEPVLNASRSLAETQNLWVGASQEGGPEPHNGGISSQAGALSLSAAWVHTCMCTSNVHGIRLSDSNQHRSVNNDDDVFGAPYPNAAFFNASRARET